MTKKMKHHLLLFTVCVIAKSSNCFILNAASHKFCRHCVKDAQPTRWNVDHFSRRHSFSDAPRGKPDADLESSPSEDDTDKCLRGLSEEISVSTVRIDDGGSDLTDRFKYKVNALMGVFDPSNAEQDTERETGNIMNAMLKFPVQYTFHVVGRTNGVEDEMKAFVSAVRSIVVEESGNQNDGVVSRVTPRGKNFTKVTLEAQVDSAAIIANIYDKLGQLETTVMQF